MNVGTATDLGERWVAAWAHTREAPVERVDGWPLVRVQSPSRDTELVCVSPGPTAFTSLIRRIEGDPRGMLTVIGTDLSAYTALSLPSTVRVDRDDETLMSTNLRPLPAAPIDPEFTACWDIDDHKITYSVEAGESVAAQGTLGILGTDATFDAIETMRNHRRRGLARHVMTTLTTYALDAGAATGVLAATAKGRMLYESLGWEPTMAMWSLMGVVTPR
jgi:GNAT superfamily N-acetyltransferase